MDDLIGELYVELHSYLLTLIRSRIYTGCPDDEIYDCLNDVFEIAIKKQFDPNFLKNPKGWLIVTTRNVVDNYNRKNLKRLTHYQLDYDMRFLAKKQDMTEDLVYQIAMEDHLIDQAISSLSERERQLYKMRFEEKMKPQDIADELDLKLCAVNTRLTRLKAKITTFIHTSIQ